MAKKITFAEEARRIYKKYQRRVDQGDTWAIESRDAELKRLQGKQEARRGEQGLTAQGGMGEFARGGKLPKYQDGGIHNFSLYDEFRGYPYDYSRMNYSGMGKGVDHYPEIPLRDARLSLVSSPVINKPSRTPFLSGNEIGSLVSQGAGALGGLGSIIAAGNVDMPVAQPIQTQDIKPMRNREEQKALERAYMNRLREARNLSPGLGVQAMSDAYTKFGQATGLAEERLQNRNIAIEEANANRRLQAATASEQMRLGAETMAARKDLDVTSAYGKLAGGIGEIGAGVFKDRADRDAELTALSLTAQPNYSVKTVGNQRYKVFSHGAYRRETPIKGGKTKYYFGNKEIGAKAFNDAMLEFYSRAPESIGQFKPEE